MLQQNGRPVAFWSGMLVPHEKRYASVKKEAGPSLSRFENGHIFVALQVYNNNGSQIRIVHV